VSKLQKLQSAKSIVDLARLLGYSPKNLAYITYKLDENSKYHPFFVPKRSGGQRKINAPVRKLKILQSRLSNLLYDCLEEIGHTKSYKKQVSHGFQRNFSIETNARKHRNKRYVFNIDLEDFFPSINFGRVRGFFIKNRSFELDPKVASIIAQIACFNNELPQGSPCSPVISNLVAQSLDFYLVQLAKKHGCTYSRYADDIVFSSNLKKFPTEIAKEQTSIKDRYTNLFRGKNLNANWIAGKELVCQIEKSGFKLNPNKTRMQYRGSRQVTTGLVVNQKVNVKSEYYKISRSQCHSLFNTGSYYHRENLSEGGEGGERNIGTLAQLEGKLNFIYQIRNPKKNLRQILVDKSGRPYNKERIKEHGKRYERSEKRKKNARGITALYRRFLYFKYLYVLEKPLLICEGKTDVIYLRCAIDQLAKSFPLLASVEDDKIELQVDLFNNHGRVMELWELGTGASFLAKLIDSYKDIFSSFRCDGLKFPVIIIVDNDSGPRGKGGVFQKIQNVSNHNDVDGEQSFYYVLENLYVIPLPRTTPGKDIDFEDLFEESTKSQSYNGKSFSKNVTDNTKEFGKSQFANHIVKANKDSIDFKNFQPLLKTIQEVLEDYQKRS